MGGVDAPGVSYACAGLVVVVVSSAVPDVPAPAVVDVVDDDEPFVAADGAVVLDPLGLDVVVVVVVLHAPRRCASGPHVDVVASVRSNDAFCASMVGARVGAGDPITINAAAKRGTTRRPPTTGRIPRRELSGRARTRARPRRRARAISRCGHRGNGYSLRVARPVPIGFGSQTQFLPQNLLKIVEIAVFSRPRPRIPGACSRALGSGAWLSGAATKCPFGDRDVDKTAAVR